MLELGDRSIGVNALRRDFGATHLLRGGLEREGNTIRVHIQLIDTATLSTIWADSLDGTVDNVLELEDKVANQIVAALAVRIMPDERARFLHRYSTDREALLLHRQAITLLWAPNESARLLTARQLFRRISEIDPNFAGGLAGESMTFSLQVLFQQSAEPTKDLEMAASLAKKAIEIDADFGLGYATHGLALALAGRFEEGVSIARQAVAVQPGYAYSQWMYGLVLVLSGDTERAIKHMTQALRLDPSESRTPYLNVIGIAHYAAGDYAAAIEFLDRNLERGGPTGPHMDLFHAGAYAELGQEDAARDMIDAMLLSYPEFPAEAWLSKWLDSDSLDETLNNLYRMGLPRN
jgi:adenylate cyclase